MQSEHNSDFPDGNQIPHELAAAVPCHPLSILLQQLIGPTLSLLWLLFCVP